ncbi:MAG: VWA domain-containing protein [Candidatus Dadabacteria bacterium]|nr:MAG: VWA domain-containing protein [Candidatus Dadabacteria bacterium]
MEIREFAFLNPAALWAVPFLALLGVFLFYRARYLDKIRLSFGVENKKSIITLSISMTTLTLMILALARPYNGYREVKVPDSGRDIALIVDISRSMLAADIKPNRMEFVKHKIIDLLRYIRTNSPGDRIVLIVFSGRSYVFCPLTSDYDIIETYVNTLSPRLITAQGSAINAAIKTAAEALGRTEAINPVAILFSDGEDLAFDLNDAYQVVSEHKIKVYTVGVGTSQGTPVILQDGHFLRDPQGNVVLTRLNRKNLESLAVKSGGKYVQATFDQADIAAIFSSLKTSSSLNKEHVSEVRSYNELGPLLAFLAFLLLITGKYFRLSPVIFTLIISIALPPRPVFSEEIPSLHDSYKAYQQGDYQKALKGFSSYYHDNPDDRRVLQALGSTYYKLGKFAAAKNVFSKLNELAKSGREKFNALYDLGNSEFMLQDYQSAIGHYKNALRIKPGDKKTLANLHLAEKLLRKQQKKHEQKRDKKKKQQSGNKQQKKESKSGMSTKKKQSKKSAQSKKEQRQKVEKQNKKRETSKSNSNTQDKRKESADRDRQQSGHDNSSELAGKKDLTQSQPHTSRDSNQTPSEMEARIWLDSLPESPILFQKDTNSQQTKNGQTW